MKDLNSLFFQIFENTKKACERSSHNKPEDKFSCFSVPSQNGEVK